MGTTTNVIAAIKAARETALKNKQAAVAKAAAPFDKEITAFDAVLRTLSGTASKPAPLKKAAPAKKAAPKKAAPKKVASAKKAAAPAKKTVTKKAVAKKAPAKKAAPKTTPKPIARPTEYQSKGTNQQKIIFVLGEAKRFLNIGEIADLIKKHEPAEDISAVKERFSKHMSAFRKQGSIVSYESSGKLYYGLPEFMEGGKAKKGHEHKTA
jgi:hypothetical protein